MRPIVLVGMMGAGKTTVGHRLADRLGRQLWDSDAELQQRFHKTGAEIERDQGIDSLHELEASLLLEALHRQNSVLCAAASVVMDEDVRDALHTAYVVYLRAPVGLLVSRVHSADTGRPLLDGDVEKTFTDIAQRREPFFEQVADVVFDVGDTEPEDIAELISSAYQVSAVSP